MRDAVSLDNIETAADERHPRCVDDGAAVKRRWSFSGLQTVVGLVTGLISIVGAAYSAVDTLRPASTGDVVVAVRDVAAQPVSAPVVEVLGADNAIVTTMIPGEDGVARRAMVPGAYRIRVVHPDYREAERAVQVTPDTTTDLTLVLERKPHAIATTTPPPSPSRVAATASARSTRAPARRGSPVDDAAESAHRSISAGRRFLSRFGF